MKKSKVKRLIRDSQNGLELALEEFMRIRDEIEARLAKLERDQQLWRESSAFGESLQNDRLDQLEKREFDAKTPWGPQTLVVKPLASILPAEQIDPFDWDRLKTAAEIPRRCTCGVELKPSESSPFFGGPISHDLSFHGTDPVVTISGGDDGITSYDEKDLTDTEIRTKAEEDYLKGFSLPPPPLNFDDDDTEPF